MILKILFFVCGSSLIWANCDELCLFAEKEDLLSSLSFLEAKKEKLNVKNTKFFILDLKTSIETIYGIRVEVDQLRNRFSQTLQNELSALDQNNMMNLFDLIFNSESEFEKHSLFSKKKKKSQEEISDELAFGFCECLTGLLLVFVPHPAVQAIGGALIGHSISQFYPALKNKSDENRHYAPKFSEPGSS